MYVEPNQMNYDAYGCDANYLSSTTYLPFAQCFVSSDSLSSNSLAFTTEVPSTSLPTEFPTDSPTDSPTEFPTFYTEFTAAPTDYPTESPTTSTADTYFIVQSYYGATGAVCSYDVLSKTAYRTNFCMETSSYTSEKYICNSGINALFVFALFWPLSYFSITFLFSLQKPIATITSTPIRTARTKSTPVLLNWASVNPRMRTTTVTSQTVVPSCLR